MIQLFPYQLTARFDALGIGPPFMLSNAAANARIIFGETVKL
jgi:hypothetical protein